MPRCFITVLLLLLTAFMSPGCTTNPATGQTQLNMMSESQEVELGKQAMPQFIQENGGEIPSLPIREYVSRLGHRLAAQSERPELPWEFIVLDSSVINAFALPGGKVFISRGLLARMKNEAQLAAVLGHEIGHVTAQHIGQQMTRGMIIQGIGVGLGVAGQATEEDWLQILGAGSQIGGTVYLLKFGRDQESQADTLGMRYMTKLAYNPVAALQVMEILAKEAAGPGQPEILSTHPLPQTRIDRIEKLIRQEYPRYNDPGVYRFEFNAFEEQVLARLRDLPPARHTPEQLRQQQQQQQQGARDPLAPRPLALTANPDAAAASDRDCPSCVRCP